MIRRASLVLAVAFTLGLGIPAVAPPDAGAVRCPANPAGIQALIDLYKDRGPLALRYPPAVAWVNERARECFGSRTLRLRAFVNGTGGLGGSSAYRMRPTWFLAPSLTVFATSAEAAPGVGSGTVYGIAVPPALGDLQHRYAGHWVVLTGAFDHPRASTCRATGPPGDTPDRTDAAAICASVFVLHSIRLADAPDTATGGVLAREQAPRDPGSWLLLAAGLLGAGLGWWRGRNPSRRHDQRRAVTRIGNQERPGR